MNDFFDDFVTQIQSDELPESEYYDDIIALETECETPENT